MTGGLALLRVAALVALPVGALGSIGWLLRAGRNTPPLLLVLFVLWVVSPFVVLALAHVVSRRWSVMTRAALYGVMLIISLGSLAVYGVAVVTSPKTPTVFFVLGPPVSWLLTAIVVAAAALISGRRST